MTDRQPPRSGSLVIGVDDEAINLKLVEAVAKSAGYTFLGASSGFECLKLLNHAVPNVIFLDLMMPEMDGFKTYRKIRNDFPSLVRCPIIFLTALSAVEDIEKAKDTGGDDYLVKPIKPDLLRQRMAYWINRGRRS